MISLQDYPRPTDDNGRGIHWSASPYHLSGHELDSWLDELLAMKIRWVKVLDDGGGSSLDLCQRLVDVGVMPVVRLYIGNPGHVGTRNLQAIERLMRAGAFYFETNNEPDLAIEWPDGKVPRNWLEIVVDNFIIDATEIIKLGGFPAFPAMGVGTIVTPFELIVQRGRQDLFDSGVWVAIHNYVLNHPVDYPYDEVNQTGKVLTVEEYEATRWGWDNDAIQTVNRLRAEGVSPGETLQQDATCFLAYQLWDQQVREAFGHSVPIMSTEGGVVVGDRQDGRYPRNDARRHEEVTLWIQNFLATEAPSWYFTVFHWLIANNAMGQNRPGWETQAWYGNWWDREFGLNGHLPTVDALKRTGAPARAEVVSDAKIEGWLSDPDGKPVRGRDVIAVQDGRTVRTTESRADGLFRLWGLTLGTYDVRVSGVLGFPRHGVSLTAHQTVKADIGLPTDASGAGGRLTDGDGNARALQTVMLYQSGRLVASTVSEQEGYYGFVPLAAGTYELRVTGAQPTTVEIDGEHPATVDFTVPVDQTFSFLVVTRRLLSRSENQGWHAFFGTVLDEAGNPVDGVRIRMSWSDAESGTEFPVAVSGADSGKPRGYFEFIHTSGKFELQIIDVRWQAQVAAALNTAGLPGQLATETVSYEIDFQLVTPDLALAESAVTGTILGETEGMSITLRAQDRLYVTRVAANGVYRFEQIPAGEYTLELECIGNVLDSVVLDGSSALELDPINIAQDRSSAIEGTVTDLSENPLANTAVVLKHGVAEQARTVTDASGHFRFGALTAGTYVVTTLEEGSTSSEVTVDGTRTYILDLRVPVAGAAKAIQHYVLFGAPDSAGTRANFRLSRKYILFAAATAGFSTAEAALAERVTLVGDLQAIGADVESTLIHAGCQVSRIAGDSYAVAEGLARLMGE